jgi:hypothetical protein
VSVDRGTFTVVLDDAGQFGEDAFNGSERYLEIAVRCPSGAGDFALLTPRQRLTAAPYARFALSGNEGPPGPPGPPGPVSIAACPAGMTRIDGAHSTLCYASGTTANWDTAEQFCRAQFAAGLCTLTQWRTAICIAGLPNPGRSWLPDVAGVATLGNVASCSGDGLGTSAYTTTLAGPCCLEWMSY